MDIKTLTEQDFREELDRFVTRNPLTHCITNDVVQAITADLLSAAGASPAMIPDAEESADFAAIADALVINIGTVTQNSYRGMLCAIESARRFGKPWGLDPVAAGLLRARDAKLQELVGLQPSLIRGNASEILALSGANAKGHGIDSLADSADAIAAGRTLAVRTGGVVVITGKTDYVISSQRCTCVEGGSAMTPRVIGTGCSLTALVTAFLADAPDPVCAAAAACTLAKRAAEIAERNSSGPGSFKAAYLDAIYALAFSRQKGNSDETA